MEWSDDAVRDWQRAHPELEIAGLVALWRIDSLARSVATFQQHVLETLELGVSEYRVLAALQPGGVASPQNPTPLAQRLGHTTGGMTKILDRLENAGLVERRADPEDARATRVALTERGLTTFERALRALVAAADHRLAGLGASERETLARDLGRFARTFERERSEPDGPTR